MNSSYSNNQIDSDKVNGGTGAARSRAVSPRERLGQGLAQLGKSIRIAGRGGSAISPQPSTENSRRVRCSSSEVQRPSGKVSPVSFRMPSITPGSYKNKANGPLMRKTSQIILSEKNLARETATPPSPSIVDVVDVTTDPLHDHLSRTANADTNANAIVALSATPGSYYPRSLTLLSCHAMSCHVMSCHVMSIYVIFTQFTQAFKLSFILLIQIQLHSSRILTPPNPNLAPFLTQPTPTPTLTPTHR